MGSHPAWLWLWCRLAAVAPIQPLAWESLYASGAALKRKKKKKNGAERYLSVLEAENFQIKALAALVSGEGRPPCGQIAVFVCCNLTGWKGGGRSPQALLQGH